MKSSAASRMASGLVFGMLAHTAAAMAPPAPVPPNEAYRQYLGLLENFAGWAEQHWNEREQRYDAAGAGVTQPRGNGGVCMVYAVLLTQLPEQATFSPRRVPRAVMLDHVRRALRTTALTNKNCTDARAVKPAQWGGPDWQSGLETEHWAFAAYLLADQLDQDTKAVVRQVATAEATLSQKTVPSRKQGNTAADDCAWNAGILGVAAAIYSDDPQAASWDEWAKRWAINMESREPDGKSARMIDGKPLRDWTVSINTYPDLTMENHGFWDLPYQVCFAAMIEPIMAYHMCGKKVPEAFYANALEEGEYILKWLTLADGDLLYPQGLDWAERDVQHSWAYTELGTMLDQPWAREAERRCLQLLTRRQAAFGDGALHANDFGYETDLATCWAYSCLLQRYFGKPEDQSHAYPDLRGGRIYPYVKVGVYRAPDMISSVTWFGARQAVMVVPNNPRALGDQPSFTAYRCNTDERQISGLGDIRLEGEPETRAHKARALPAFAVDGEPIIKQGDDVLTVSFSRTRRGVATQMVGYCALPTGEVLVFSQWRARKDIKVAELVDHPFYWIEIPGYLSPRPVQNKGKGLWSIDQVLQMQVIGEASGRPVKSGIAGAARSGPFIAVSSEVLMDTVCIYQAEVPGRVASLAGGDPHRVVLNGWLIERADDGQLCVKHVDKHKD